MRTPTNIKWSALALVAAVSLPAIAQTKTAAKPGAKPAGKSAAKPAAKPAVKPTAAKPQVKSQLEKDVESLNAFLAKNTVKELKRSGADSTSDVSRTGWKAEFAAGNHLVLSSFSIRQQNEAGGVVALRSESTTQVDIPLKQFKAEWVSLTPVTKKNRKRQVITLGDTKARGVGLLVVTKIDKTVTKDDTAPPAPEDTTNSAQIPVWKLQLPDEAWVPEFNSRLKKLLVS